MRWTQLDESIVKLIGMLDSPYVRRLAISLQLLGLRFEHRSVSVFRTFGEFRQINPVVKAPTLVCDDGVVLMDSTLILQYAEALARPRSLMPADLKELQHELRLTGLALAACEKSGQIIYERGLRPPEKQHEPWVERVTGQLLAAYDELERELGRQALEVTSSSIRQAGVSVAVAWQFTQRVLPKVVPATGFPRLAAFSAAAEALPEFMAAPYGEGTYKADPVDALILDLLEWIGNTPRPYLEVIEAWRTSCPRLPVWEEANARGFIEQKHSEGTGAMVFLSPSGRAYLSQQRRAGSQA